LVVCVLGAGPAGAHSGLVAASPEPGAQVGGRVTRIELVFDAGVSNPQVTLTAPGEVDVEGTVTQVAPDRLSFEMGPLRVEGEYIVRYGFASADGDLTESAFAFTYRAAAPEPGPITRPEPPAGDRQTNWAVPIILLVVAAALGGLVLRTVGRNPG
jgi:methionine-rich copper-binding protein CopC